MRKGKGGIMNRKTAILVAAAIVGALLLAGSGRAAEGLD
jgi:outer membrane murein-binding lipoprotein Lpp